METFNVFSGDAGRDLFGKVRTQEYFDAIKIQNDLDKDTTQFSLDFYDEVKSLLKDKEICVLDGPVAVYEGAPVRAKTRLIVEENLQPEVRDVAKLFCDADEVKNSTKIFLYVVQRIRSVFPDPSSDEEMTMVDFETLLPYKGKGRIRHGVKIRYAVL